MRRSGRAPALSFITADSEKAQAALEQIQVRCASVTPEEADIIVVLGGDGTMLEALHKVHMLGKPVYGMNCGSVGFLMNPRSTDHLAERLEKAHKVDIYPLRMTAVDSDGRPYDALAFNEVSLLRETRQTAKLRIKVDEEVRIDELVCDGVLLSTPAGSTAYNFSGGGPILPLTANVLALTPISAFRPRRWRGALLPNHLGVEIDVLDPKKRPVSVTADSKEIRNITSVSIHQSRTLSCLLLFDPDHKLEDRILKEQFVH